MEELNLNQLEVGEWYEVKPSSGWIGWLHKHVKIINGNQANGTTITTRLWSNHCEDYTWCSGYTFRKATKEQLKSVLPKDHPDYPIENSDYKWMLMLEDNAGGNRYNKGEIIEIVVFKECIKEFWYNATGTRCNTLVRIAEGKIKPFLTKEAAQEYWDKLNQSKPVEKPIETPKTKQLSDLKKGDWVKHIIPSNASFILNHLYKLDRDWDSQEGLVLNAQNRGDGYSPHNTNNFTVPTQQEIETWEKSLIKDEPKEFVLPEKWCIKVLGGSKNNPEIYQWRLKNSPGGPWQNDGYLNEVGYHSSMKPVDCIEITFEQFEKYVLKSKVTVEDKPKEDMKTIPKYWYIENKYQEVRDYLADTYNEFCIKSWNNYEYVGFDGTSAHKGCHGFCSLNHVENGATKITVEQFREYFLSKPKEVQQDDYSWWCELEAGDVIESLTDLTTKRKKGDLFTVFSNRNGIVYYAPNYNSCSPSEWKLISKAKDVKTTVAKDQLGGHVFNTQALIQHRDIADVWREVYPQYTHMMLPPLVGKVSPVPNNSQKYIMGVDPADGVSAQVYSWGIQQLPQPEETEIVPISKYFKIRN